MGWFKHKKEEEVKGFVETARPIEDRVPTYEDEPIQDHPIEIPYIPEPFEQRQIDPEPVKNFEEQNDLFKIQIYNWDIEEILQCIFAKWEKSSCTEIRNCRLPVAYISDDFKYSVCDIHYPPDSCTGEFKEYTKLKKDLRDKISTLCSTVKDVQVIINFIKKQKSKDEKIFADFEEDISDTEAEFYKNMREFLKSLSPQVLSKKNYENLEPIKSIIDDEIDNITEVRDELISLYSKTVFRQSYKELLTNIEKNEVDSKGTLNYIIL